MGVSVSVYRFPGQDKGRQVSNKSIAGHHFFVLTSDYNLSLKD